MDGHYSNTDKRTDMTKLIVVFRDFSNSPNKMNPPNSSYLWMCLIVENTSYPTVSDPLIVVFRTKVLSTMICRGNAENLYNKIAIHTSTLGMKLAFIYCKAWLPCFDKILLLLQ